MKLQEIQNMHDALAYIEQTSGDGPLIQYFARRKLVDMSAAEFLQEVRRLSAVLLHEGLQRRHVGLMGRNSVQWLIAFCAITNIGATAALMNPDLNAQEIRRAIQHTDLDALFFDADAAERVKVYTERADYPTFCLQEKHYADSSSAGQPYEAGPEDIMCILYTSGTTGDQKAVMLSNRAVVSGFRHGLATTFRNTARYLSVMPLHHVGGVHASLTVLLKENCVLGLVDGPMRAKRGIEQMKPDLMFAVPSLLRAIEHELTKQQGGERSAFGESLRCIICGGAQLPIDLISTFQKRDITILNVYGATETTGVVFSHEAAGGDATALGRPQNAEAKIEHGELLLRGDMMMSGYYNDPEATEEALKDGWYHTGDLARVDEDGNYYLTGRKKNLIILSNGENISPEELEKYLVLSPDIAEVVVTEYQDALWAAVWPNYPDACSDEERERIRERVRTFTAEYNDRMPTYKRLHGLRFWDSPLPKNATGKVLRSQVKL